MGREPALSGEGASADRGGGARCIAGFVFVVVLGCAFWVGVLWAAQPLFH
jgi:hypothetical protein